MAGQGKVQRVIDSYGGVPCTWIRPNDCPVRPGEPCGQIHETCRGHVRAKGRDPDPERLARRGDPCGNHAMEGQTRCRLHGGKNPDALAKAERTLEAEAAARAISRRLGRRGATPVTDPAHELARLAGEAIAWKDAALELVAKLEQAADTTTSSEDGDGDPLGLGTGVVVLGSSGLDVHPLVKLAERAQERGAKVLAEMVKLGFVERRVQIEEAQAEALQSALTAVLADHGIDPGLVLPDLAARLRAIEATATEVR